MWITSKKDINYRYIKLYNEKIAEYLRQEAKRTGRRLWVDSKNIDNYEINQLNEEIKSATPERCEKIRARLWRLIWGV